MGQPLRVLDDPSEILNPVLFKDAFEASPEGLVLASHGRILYANLAFADLFGYGTPAEVVGKLLGDFREEGEKSGLRPPERR